MTRFLNPLAVAVSVVIAVALRQPMVGVLLISSVIVTMILCRSFPHLPWMILGAKLALVALVSFIAPKLWPQAGGLIPINPDQWFYVDTAERIAEALRASPFAVDYRGIVGLHNRLYSVVLGWLAFLNGGGSIILYRLFNVFVSLLLAAAAAALARSLYPSSPHIALIVFAGVALLPSVNAYALFVLRDVLIAALLMTVALGLFARKFWLVAMGLVLTYFTRIQLFLLLAGAIALFIGLRVAGRMGRYSSALRLAMAGLFVIAGYFVAPHVLPPEYDYTQALSLTSFGRFLVRALPSLAGLDFLFANQENLELSRGMLVLVRLLLFDTWLVPLLFVGAVTWYRRADPQWRELCLWVWAVSLGYVSGYWMTYGAMSIRLAMPLYPLFLVVVAIGLRSLSRLSEIPPSQAGKECAREP